MFNGPLFIIGMPRSGTKLLRALLIGHPKIRIPLIETEFFPYLVSLCKDIGNIHGEDKFNKLYYRITKCPYFMYASESEKLIKKNIWRKECRDFSAAGLFEALIRHDACAPRNSDLIWGDKSPSYITKTQLLKEHFPQARFIHIIRDVRDYCLSVNKTWGKNMIRAAVRWDQSIKKLKEDIHHSPESYLEIRYEDLLDSTQDILEKICVFLDIEYNSGMINLSLPPEHFGDAKGKNMVIKDNKCKYKDQLSIEILKNIEGVAAETLKKYGYPTTYGIFKKSVSPLRMKLYQIQDAVNLINSKNNKNGIIEAVKFHMKYFRLTRS